MGATLARGSFRSATATMRALRPEGPVTDRAQNPRQKRLRCLPSLLSKLCVAARAALVHVIIPPACAAV